MILPTENEEIRVLHVDDDPEFREVTATHLESEDKSLRVEAVANANATMQALSDDGFDCVVSDYELPETDGIALLERVRSEHPDLPFILFTGKGSEAIASRAISSGVSDYLQKEAGSKQFDLLENRIRNQVERTRAILELEEREAHLRHVQAMGNFGSWDADIPADRLVWSEAGRRIHGTDQRVMTYDELLTSVHTADRESVADAWERALAGDEYDIEYRVRPEDGEERWIRARAEVEFADDGSPVRATGVIQDVTERKSRETQLREERDKREVLFQNQHDAIVEFRLLEDDTRIVDVNERFTEIFGFEAEDVIGESVHDTIIPQDDRLDEEETRFRRQAGPGEPVEAHAFRRTADGVREFRLRGFSFEMPNGELRSYAVYTDVTERREREYELEAYEKMTNSASDMLYMMDTEGRFEFLNDAATELTGYALDELLGEHTRLLMSEADVERGRELIRELLRDEESGRSEAYEWELQTADGETLPVESHLTLLVTDGEWEGTVGVVRDVSGRIERQKRLERFITFISHDMRNPLNVASANVDLALEEGTVDRLAPVERSLERIEGLIDELNTWSKMSGKVEAPSPIEVSDIVRRSWSHVPHDGAALEIAGAATLLADANRLQQILENLLRNAVKHGGEDVTVTVRADPDAGTLTVEDDGPGIPPDARDDIFEMGHSGHADSSGIGLAIVEEGVAAHGWEIDVGESPKGGAKFVISGVEYRA